LEELITNLGLLIETTQPVCNILEQWGGCGSQAWCHVRDSMCREEGFGQH